MSVGLGRFADRDLLGPEATRVRAVVRAGKRIADPADPLGREARERLPDVTGLSPASVELALAEHLETQPTDDDLAALIGRAGSAPRCHVVLSANVCTAPLRAIAIACATAPRVLAKPSRRDPVVAELCVRALAEDPAFAGAGGSIAIVGSATPSPGDALDVYGSDETIAAIRATLPPGVQLRAHGTGFGVALVGPDADLDRAAADLARDVAPFDQHGCLSPRIALVLGGVDRASSAARWLARELSSWSVRAPRGSLPPSDAAALRRYVDTVTALGACIEGDGFVVGLDESPRSLLLPPPARAVHVVPSSPADLAELLAPWASKIAALGLTADLALEATSRTSSRSAGKDARESDAHPRSRPRGSAAAGEPAPPKSLASLVQGGARPVAPDPPEPLAELLRDLLPGARVSRLGWMQRPPLDGPVDLRDDDRATARRSPSLARDR